MTLGEFLSTLNTPSATLILKDKVTTNTLVEMKVPGYTHLDDTIENCTVVSWQITAPTPTLSVIIQFTPDPEPNEEQTR